MLVSYSPSSAILSRVSLGYVAPDNSCLQHSLCLLTSAMTNTGTYPLRTWSQFGCILAPSHDRVKRCESSIPQEQHRRGHMEATITADIVVAYAQCPRKAYLLLFSPD